MKQNHLVEYPNSDDQTLFDGIIEEINEHRNTKNNKAKKRHFKAITCFVSKQAIETFCRKSLEAGVTHIEILVDKQSFDKIQNIDIENVTVLPIVKNRLFHGKAYSYQAGDSGRNGFVISTSANFSDALNGRSFELAYISHTNSALKSFNKIFESLKETAKDYNPNSWSSVSEYIASGLLLYRCDNTIVNSAKIRLKLRDRIDNATSESIILKNLGAEIDPKSISISPFSLNLLKIPNIEKFSPLIALRTFSEYTRFGRWIPSEIYKIIRDAYGDSLRIYVDIIRGIFSREKIDSVTEDIRNKLCSVEVESILDPDDSRNLTQIISKFRESLTYCNNEALIENTFFGYENVEFTIFGRDGEPAENFISQIRTNYTTESKSKISIGRMTENIISSNGENIDEWNAWVKDVKVEIHRMADECRLALETWK